MLQHGTDLLHGLGVDASELLLAAEELGESIFDEYYDVLLRKAWNDVFIDAQLLEAVQLEEICKPENVLHKEDVMTFNLFVAAGPKHLASVDVIKDDSEGLGSRPQRKKNPYLLCIINVFNYISKLLWLSHKSLLKSEEFHILHDETYFIVVIIRVLVAVAISIAR